VYVRPATLSVTLTGFNDRTVVEQAVADALASLPPKPVSGSPAAKTPAAPSSGVTRA
jgi:hypothetical protein